MSVPDELRRYVPRTDLYDSLELVHYHMPVEQPPATASYIIFKKGNKTYAKNGTYGHIEYENTDSASVIQNAINNLTETGGRIIIKGGTYTISSEILIKSKVYLEGEGKYATILDCQEGSGGRIKFAKGCQQAGLRNLSILIRDNPSLYGVDIDYLLLENLYVKGGSVITAYFPVDEESWNTNVTVINCDFTKDPNYSSTNDTFAGGNWKNWKFLNCTFSGTGKTGYGNIGLSVRTCEDVLIANCIFYDNPASGTSLEDGTRSKYVNCISRDNGVHGFLMDLVNATPPLYEIGYLNCRAINNDQDGFHIEQSDYVVIHGIARANGNHGCMLAGSSYCLVHLISEGNTGDGIYVHQGATERAPTHNMISGIYVGNGGYGINEGGTASLADYNLYDGVIITGNTTGSYQIQGANSVLGDNIA